jgi:hypothetical protein
MKLGNYSTSQNTAKIIDKNSCSRLRSANRQLGNKTSLSDGNENGNTAIETAVLITK